MKTQFGSIYGGNNPTHGVYSEASISQHGDKAVAISHHWSEQAAEVAAAKESRNQGRSCIVVAYE